MIASPEAQRLAIIARGLGLWETDPAQKARLQEFLHRLPGSLDDRVRKVSDVVIARFAPPDEEWKLDVMGIWEDHAIFEKQGKLFRIPYTIDDNGDVSLGDQATEVNVEIDVAPKESARAVFSDLLAEAGRSTSSIREFIGLSEGTDTGAEFPICIIKAGLGSSGFYPKEVLQRDGVSAFPVNTKMFVNHASLSERVNQPERRLEDLAGVTTATPFWDESGAAGPGLYTKCKVFSDHATTIKEKAAHTGVSIVAAGVKEKGQVGDYKGFIVKEISQGLSIDFVTAPGAGGKALPLAESETPNNKKEITMSAEEIQQKLDQSAAKLKGELEEKYAPIVKENEELKAQLARRQEVDLTVEAIEFATDEGATLLKDVNLSAVQRKGALSRIVEKASANPPLKDGALSKAEYREKISEAVKAEVDYIAQLTGGGKPKDLSGPANELPSLKTIRESMAANFSRFGMSKEAAERAAKGRAI